MRHYGRGISVSKWLGTILCLILIAAAPYCVRRWVIWDSPELRYEVLLGLGAVHFSWRPEGWRLEAERYPPTPGWTVANYSQDLSALQWWFERSSNRSWESLAIPLWIPFALLALPTGILWYRDRRRTRQAIERLIGRLRPRRRLRLSFWNVGGSFVFQVLVVIPVCAGSVMLCEFLFPFPRSGAPRLVCDLMEGGLVAFVLGAPVWAGLWAWLWVRWRNRLLISRPGCSCIECGYDLTGNTSGRCPECGVQIKHRIETATASEE